MPRTHFAPMDAFNLAATLSDTIEAHSQASDYSFALWREIFKAVVQTEKRSMETGETIALEFEVTQRRTGIPDSVIKVALVCEPGKPARASDYHVRLGRNKTAPLPKKLGPF